MHCAVQATARQCVRPNSFLLELRIGEHVSTVKVAADSKVRLCCCLAVRARGQVLRCLQEDCESWIEGINQSMHL